MPSLIPAEVFQQMFNQQRQASQMPQEPPPGLFNPAMQLQTAQNMAVQRRRGSGGGMGQTATSQQLSPGRSPADQSLYAAKLMAAYGVGEDERDQYKGLDPHQLEHVLQIKQQHQKMQHPFAQPAPAPAQDSDAGGSMTVTRGQGPNAMSPDAMRQWSQRVAMDHMPHAAGDVGGGPGGAGGFAISGMPTGAAQPPQDPAAQMLAAFKGHVPDELLTAAAQGLHAGVSPQQIYGHLQTAMQQQTSGANRETQAQEKQQRQMQMTQYKQLNQQLSKLHKDAFQMGINLDQEASDQDDPQTTALKQQYFHTAQQISALEHGMQGGGEQPQQQQQPQPQFSHTATGPNGQKIGFDPASGQWHPIQ